MKSARPAKEKLAKIDTGFYLLLDRFGSVKEAFDKARDLDEKISLIKEARKIILEAKALLPKPRRGTGEKIEKSNPAKLFIVPRSRG